MLKRFIQFCEVLKILNTSILFFFSSSQRQNNEVGKCHTKQKESGLLLESICFHFLPLHSFLNYYLLKIQTRENDAQLPVSHGNTMCGPIFRKDKVTIVFLSK